MKSAECEARIRENPIGCDGPRTASSNPDSSESTWLGARGRSDSINASDISPRTEWVHATGKASQSETYHLGRDGEITGSPAHDLVRDFAHLQDSSGQLVALPRLLLGLEEFVERHGSAVVGRADPQRHDGHGWSPPPNRRDGCTPGARPGRETRAMLGRRGPYRPASEPESSALACFSE